jgi:MerR family transcriptional regulator, copper efflux regulator
MDGFSIGELAKQANVHVETLRYYERRGLIPKPHRTVSNYRVYSSENLRRVKFIKQAQELGFSLNEIKKLLALRATPRARCADVRTYAAHKIEDIDGKIRSLARMRKTLEKLIAECSGDGPATLCPILESLDSEPSTVSQKVKLYRKEKGL